MILTVTPNPAIDKTLYVEELKKGELNIVKNARTDPGGKGINVSKALCSYGMEQIATGFVGGANGRLFMDLLDDYVFRKDFLVISGETRINIKVIDIRTGIVTEINEPGPVILKEEAEKFTELLMKYLEECELVILSGSLPKGLPSDFYGRCIRLASGMKVRTVLDADGETLRHGCGARPFAIKPNIHEFERLTGKTFSDYKEINYKEIKDEIKSLHKSGIELILVSLGDKGSILSYRNKIYHAMPIPVQIKSTVASGDAMVAALAYCIINDFPPEKTARITSAAGSLTAALDGSDMAEWEDIKKEYDKVHIEEI
ncbi:tagatose-6-phosphate kinase LacC [Thermoclostridium stercorarium subsp. stercorarium DSM 8532]|jgi:1-phosphofructokinase|uniref:Tagatose-6-phosphate kinase n=4 Tax=Thermoclostridium stercorarium TaxID=1510 RepID=L7VNG3_THES1|nr:1-phosphofructokinase [Thermoclostridium stercorarium]AGC68199.1 tagatose-6-phosphate kinase LacC [Thermoclostridium stercorarium subsp. stercorarium DSM 8532]AGI39227.1 fructose-1-phosphate kinase [Thermoclostridium stercorarium subsp. stercorarium DSM 8532]ANW98571.1 1-phosphofructokinase [Thermoclostridium stercorarium subsp. thermolacticum DSM 2910]ANX01109.1 1-phosphofructokinase [Thermoclostridium stercorarium subsp. leptospartum DSM 9219]UZQ86726.1 1-phosphofructokinase [Thermoclostr